MAKKLIQSDWNDSPHLTEKMKADLFKSIRPHQRDARMKGIPVLGAGAIYPIAEQDITCLPFSIPPHWRKAYALDVGWNRTAALWLAIADDNTMFIYSEHYLAEAPPPVHADAIKARGYWINGVVDPASRGRNQADGARLFNRYQELGLRISYADNSIEAGLDKVWDLLSSGRLKIFSNLANFFYEFRLYRRDEKGKIVKKHDHLMDALRYLIMSGQDVASPAPGSFGNRRSDANRHQTDWNPLEALAREDNLR